MGMQYVLDYKTEHSWDVSMEVNWKFRVLRWSEKNIFEEIWDFPLANIKLFKLEWTLWATGNI